MSHFQIVIFGIILVSLILLAAFFSCAETSLMAINRYRLRHQARVKKRYAVRLIKLLKRPDRLLGAILIGNTFANMIASSLATLIAFHFWGDTGALLVAVALTFVVLIFAEITPKTVAAIYPERIARWVVFPVQIILKLLYPAVWFANAISNGLLKILRVQVGSQSIEPLSREELRSIVFDTAGKISRQYQNMLLSILDLGKLTVNDVMVPRHEVEGIDMEATWKTIVEQLKKLHQDRVPVYRGNINNLIGVLYIRDVMQYLLTDNKFDKESLKEFLQEPYFVPEGTSLNVQLGYFQQTTQHHRMAFVVDEYGEILGLLTLYDILEEIVGDFTATVSGIKNIQKQPDNSYLVDGSIMIREFNRATDFELPLRGPRTVNGLIVEYLEALPHPGTAVLIADYPIEIIKVHENRVKLAKIFPRLPQKNNANE